MTKQRTAATSRRMAAQAVVRVPETTVPEREAHPINTYVILRRSRWASPEELQVAVERSAQVGDEMPEDIRWIRSYVLEEDGGSLGAVCIYQASSPEAIREHDSRAGLPDDEIIPVADTVVVRSDPRPAPA